MARSPDHFQPGGIFSIRRLAWVTRRAGAEGSRKRSVLVEAFARSPSSARWRSQAVSEVARAASCSQAVLRGVVDRGQVAGAAGLELGHPVLDVGLGAVAGVEELDLPAGGEGGRMRRTPSPGAPRAWPAWSPAAGCAG